MIKFRWGALPEEQREGIKNYISNLIIKLSSDETVFRREKVFLNKLNIILVQACPTLAGFACLYMTYVRPVSDVGAVGCRDWCYLVMPLTVTRANLERPFQLGTGTLNHVSKHLPSTANALHLSWCMHACAGAMTMP